MAVMRARAGSVRLYSEATISDEPANSGRRESLLTGLDAILKAVGQTLFCEHSEHVNGRLNDRLFATAFSRRHVHLKTHLDMNKFPTYIRSLMVEKPMS